MDLDAINATAVIKYRAEAGNNGKSVELPEELRSTKALDESIMKESIIIIIKKGFLPVKTWMILFFMRLHTLRLLTHAKRGRVP